MRAAHIGPPASHLPSCSPTHRHPYGTPVATKAAAQQLRAATEQLAAAQSEFTDAVAAREGMAITVGAAGAARAA